MSIETKTIDQFLAENPDVDVSNAWERCYGILADIKGRIASRFEGLERHPSCEGREYYTSPNGEFEGSFNAWSGPGCEWLVNSWLGNRKASILDMNATCFLGQETDVPHLFIIFGTLPRLFFCAEYVPRRDLMVDDAYLDKYYGGDVNEDYLALRGDPELDWLVSHGTYMRAMMSPVSMSITGELKDSNIDKFEAYANKFTNRWLGWLDNATPVPESERAAQQAYDHKVRSLGYERDPMNKLAVNVFGESEVERMLAMRKGEQQMQEARTY